MIRVTSAIWIGLRFDSLALEVMDRADDRPMAVIEQQRIYASDAEGIEPGMAVATAHALVADLVATARQPAREAQALENLALWAYQITPAVTVAADCTLLLEIGSCQRLYGDLSHLLERMQAALAERGHRVAIGLAHTPQAAWLLALMQPPIALEGGCRIDVPLLQRQLAQTPIAALPIDEKVKARLLHMGIESLGRLLSFQPALLGKRFGVEFVRYLQQLTGHLPDPQVAFELKPEFEQSLAFLDGVHNRQMLLFPMKRLLQSLSDYLIARQLNCRSLQWLFGDAHCICATMDIELSRPHHRWKSLLDLTQLKLDQVKLPEAVFSLTLYADQFLPAGAVSFQLFAEDSAEDEGHALLDKLASRLGAAALQRLSTGDSLWPECASHSVALSERPEQSSCPAGERPTWLLTRPEPLRERDQRLWWRAPLEILRGPERVESPPDLGEVKRRDYYIAREQSGRICWIFREMDSGNWFVHGLFG